MQHKRKFDNCIFPYHVEISSVESLVPTYETDGAEVTFAFRKMIMSLIFTEAIVTVTDEDDNTKISACC